MYYIDVLSCCKQQYRLILFNKAVHKMRLIFQEVAETIDADSIWQVAVDAFEKSQVS